MWTKEEEKTAIGAAKKKKSSNEIFRTKCVSTFRSLCPPSSLFFTLCLIYFVSICLPLSFPMIFVDFFGMQVYMYTHTFIGLYLLIFSFFSFIQRVVEIPLFAAFRLTIFCSCCFFFMHFRYSSSSSNNNSVSFVLWVVTKHIQTSRSKMQNFLSYRNDYYCY